MDGFKVYVGEVEGLLGSADSVVEGRRWSEKGFNILKLEDKILDIATARVSTNPTYTSVPNEATLDEARSYNLSLYEAIVGAEMGVMPQAKEWASQAPRHCLCLWVDTLSLLLNIDQKDATHLLFDVTSTKNYLPALRQSIAFMLGHLLSREAKEEELLPTEVLKECMRMWHRRNFYQLKCIRSILEAAMDSLHSTRQVGSEQYIAEVRTFAVRWVSQKGLVKLATLELMLVMESLREHAKVREALIARMAAYEANLSRIGAALRNAPASLTAPFPFGNMEQFFAINDEACLKRLWDLLAILLASVATVHIEKLEDFHHLFALCPNLINFKQWDSKNPLGLREPERGISATEYDLFVEQNLFEKEWSVTLFEVTPILSHVLTGAIHSELSRLRLPALSGNEDAKLSTSPYALALLKPVVREKQLPFLEGGSSVAKYISSENVWGRLMLWIAVGLKSVVDDESEEIFQAGLQKWECVQHLREVINGRYEPWLAMDKMLLNLILQFLAPFYSQGLRPLSAIISMEISSMNGRGRETAAAPHHLDMLTAAPPPPPPRESHLWSSMTGGELTARGGGGGRSSRLDRASVSSKRKPSPMLSEVSESRTTSLAGVLMMFDSLTRRLPRSASQIVVFFDQIGESYNLSFSAGENDGDDRSAWSDLTAAGPGWYIPNDLLSCNQRKAICLSAYGQLGASLLAALPAELKQRIATRVFGSLCPRVPGIFSHLLAHQYISKQILTAGGESALTDVARVFTSDPSVKPLYVVSQWDALLRCRAYAGDIGKENGSGYAPPGRSRRSQDSAAEAQKILDGAESWWMSVEEKLTLALNFIGTDIAALTQKLFYDFDRRRIVGCGGAGGDGGETAAGGGETESCGLLEETVDWVTALVSLKIAALTALLETEDSTLDEILLQQLLQRLPFLRLDLWMLEKVFFATTRSRGEAGASALPAPPGSESGEERGGGAQWSREVKSTYLASILAVFRKLIIGGNATEALESLQQQVPSNCAVKGGGGGSVLAGWKQFVTFCEAHVLPWLSGGLQLSSLACWRLAHILFEIVSHFLSCEDWEDPDYCGEAPPESPPEVHPAALYLASHLMSDTSPWLQVLLQATRQACNLLNSVTEQAAYATQTFELYARVVQAALNPLCQTIYLLVFKNDAFSQAWRLLAKPSGQAATTTAVAATPATGPDKSIVNVLPGLTSFASLLCRPLSAFIWALPKDCAAAPNKDLLALKEGPSGAGSPPLITLLAQYMALKPSSAISYKLLLPVFCATAQRSPSEISAQLLRNNSLLEDLQNLFAFWLRTEQTQIDSSHAANSPAPIAAKVTTPPAQRQFHNHQSTPERWTTWSQEPPPRHKPRTRPWRLFAQETLPPFHLHGTFRQTKLLTLPIKTPPRNLSTETNLLPNKKCSHPTRHSPAILAISPFTNIRTDLRDPPRLQILHFLLESVDGAGSEDTEIQPTRLHISPMLSPGLILLGLKTFDQSLRVRKIIHTCGTMDMKIDPTQDRWDDAPACAKLLQGLCLLATLDVSALRLKCADEGNAEREWFRTCLAPLVQESILASECVSRLYTNTALRDVFDKVMLPRNAHTDALLKPFVHANDPIISSSMIDWFSSQSILIAADFASKLADTNDDFNCGLCLAQHKPNKLGWDTEADTRIRYSISRACKLARAILRKETAENPYSLPPFLQAIDHTLQEAATKEFYTNDFHLLLDYQESTFNVYLTAIKVTLEQARQALIVNMEEELWRVREDYLSPLVCYVKEMDLSGPINAMGNLAGSEWRLASHLKIGWGLLWLDVLELLVQRVLGLGEVCRAVDRSLICESLLVCEKLGRFGRQIVEKEQVVKGRSGSVSRLEKCGDRLARVADGCVLSLVECDRRLLELEVGESMDVELLDDVMSVYDYLKVNPPLRGLVINETREMPAVTATESLPIKFIRWAEVILRDKSQYMTALCLLHAVLSAPSHCANPAAVTAATSANPPPAFSQVLNLTHSASKVIEVCSCLRSELTLEGRLLAFECVMWLLNCSGVEAWRQASPLLQSNFNWSSEFGGILDTTRLIADDQTQQLRASAAASATVSSDNKNAQTASAANYHHHQSPQSTIVTQQKRYKLAAKLFRSLSVIFLTEGSPPAVLLWPHVLAEPVTTPSVTQLALAMAASEWLWSLEFATWRLLQDSLTSYLTESTRRPPISNDALLTAASGANARNALTDNIGVNVKSRSRLTGTSSSSIGAGGGGHGCGQSQYDGVSDFIRGTSVWKSLEDALVGALQAEDGQQGFVDYGGAGGGSANAQDSQHLHSNSQNYGAESKQIRNALHDLITAASWYALVIYRLLSILLRRPESALRSGTNSTATSTFRSESSRSGTSRQVTNNPQAEILPSTDIFDRISTLLRLVSQVRATQYRTLARLGPDVIPTSLRDDYLDPKSLVFDNTEKLRQRLIVILLRCLNQLASHHKYTIKP